MVVFTDKGIWATVAEGQLAFEALARPQNKRSLGG
jgi:hypothetical protein